MARQIGPIKITGTVDGVTFYKMDGVYYARMKSSLTAKKVKTGASFALTRRYAQWLGEASKMASQAYRTLPREERRYELFCELKKLAHKRVKEGAAREMIWKEMEDHLVRFRVGDNVSHSFAPLSAASRSLRVNVLTAKGVKDTQGNAKSGRRGGLLHLLPSAIYLSPSLYKGRTLINTRGLLVKEKTGYYIYAHPPACKRPRPIFYEKAYPAYSSLSCPV